MARLTIQQLFDRYKKDHLRRLKSGERIERSLIILLAEDFAKPVAEFSADDITAAVARIQTTAPTHANRCLAYVRAFLGWGVKVGLLDSNVAVAVPMQSLETRRDRILTLGEIVDIWRATEVLGYPFSPAVRVMILTGMQREQVGSMKRTNVEFGELTGSGVWRLPAHRHDFARLFNVTLANLTRSEIFQAMRRSPASSRFVFTTTKRTSISGWAKVKRRLDDEISRQRTDDGRTEMPPWRLDDLRRSLVANLEEHFAIDHGVAISCLHVQTGFGSLKQRFIAYSGCADDWRAQILAAWARLVEEASRPGARIDEALSRVQSEAEHAGLGGWTLNSGSLSEDALEEMHVRGFRDRPARSIKF